MMQLITIASFLVLFCDIFGRVAAENTITTYGINIPVIDSIINGTENSCALGVKKVSVFMFTSDNPQREFININETCNLINSEKIIFLSHGFVSNAMNYNFSDLAAKLVEHGYVVYSIDWSQASCFYMPLQSGLLFYPSAANNTYEVGRRLASMTKSLIDVCKVPLSNISYFGHSLGAHVVGFACKDLQKSGYGICPLIIGSDPAAPLFSIPIPKGCPDRLCRTDATHVRVPHSSALGIQYSMGSSDYWMNNGFGQPACDDLNVTIGNNYLSLSVEASIELFADVRINCSHSINIIYVMNMLDNPFVGIPVPPRSDPSLEPGCSSNTTNCTFVDKRIYDKDYNATGDYCVPVIAEDPYYTTTNSTCQ